MRERDELVFMSDMVAGHTDKFWLLGMPQGERSLWENLYINTQINSFDRDVKMWK